MSENNTPPTSSIVENVANCNRNLDTARLVNSSFNKMFIVAVIHTNVSTFITTYHQFLFYMPLRDVK